MATLDKARWLLVGPGDIAQKRVAPALAAAENSEIVGLVYHTRRRQAEELAKKFSVRRVFDQFDRALDESQANAVYLATPVFLHSAHAVAAMESGRHVLIEKPLALDEADGAKIVAAAKRTGMTAGCAYYRRFFPRYRHAVETLAGGELGDLVLVRMVYFGWFDPAPEDPKHWRVVRSKSGGGPLADMGSHMFDMLIGLFGMPVSVYARCDNLVHKWDVEDSASAVMTLAGGAHAVAVVNWNSRAWRHEFEIVGSRGKVNWLPCDTGPVIKTVGRDVTDLDMPNAENVHLPLVQDFVDAVVTGRQPACPVEEANKTGALLDAIYASAAGNREVKVRP